MSTLICSRYGQIISTPRASLDGFIRLGDEKRSDILDEFMYRQASALSEATGQRISWRRGPDHDCAVFCAQLGWFEVKNPGPGVLGDGI